MANLLQQITDSLDSADFDVSLSGEIGKLEDIARLATTLRDNPAGIAEFTAKLAGLNLPAWPEGASVQTGLADARAAIGNVSGGAAPDALADLSRFSTLVTDRLVPALSRSIAAAKSIEAVATARFTCPPEADPAAPPGPAPDQPTGATRTAIVSERATELSDRIDQLPSPLTPGNLIDFLTGLAASPRSPFLPVSIPVLDDILVPVLTLGRWSQATPAEVGTELEATLTQLRDRLTAATTGLMDARLAGALALETPLRAAELQSFSDAYITAATAMADALTGNDTPTAVTEAATLNTAIDAFETLRTTQAADFTPLTTAAAQHLTTLPHAVLDRLFHLAMQLEPFDSGAFISAFDPPEPADATAEQALRDHLAPILDFMEDLGAKLDLSAVETEVGDVASEAQDIADEVTAALGSVAVETRAALATVETAMEDLPLDALTTEIRAGITDAGDALQQALQSAFTPLREALATAIAALSDALDTLDPAAVRAALEDAIASLTGILQDPAIVSAVGEIRAGLDQAAEAAGSLSFAPVTDEVIGLIEQMESGLRAINDTDLNDAIIGMLNTALAVLPPDLRPVTRPLIDDLGVAIEQGPVEILEAIREKPQEIVDRIRAFNPAPLVTQSLGAPFSEAASGLKSVKPSAMIGQLDQALAAERVRLKSLGSPSKALEPVTDAFDALLQEFDTLSPGKFLEPIETAIENAVADVIDASPVDEIFDEIDDVFETIQSVLDTINAVEQALTKTAEALTALQNPDAAIDAWRDTALDRVSDVPNAAALDTLLSEIAAAIDAARQADLLSHYDTATASLLATLDGLDPEAEIARMVALHQRLRPLIRALPAGADRTTLETALNRFDPLNPAHTGGLRAASLLHQAVKDTRANLDTLTGDFADQLHGPDGVLTTLRNGAGDASLLRDAVATEIEKALAPLRYLIGQLGCAAVPVSAIAASVSDLGTRLTASIGNILTGPDSLQSIAQTTQAVVDAIRSIDLAFLRESLDEVFATVRAEIEAAGPAPVIAALDAEFSAAIDRLDLSLALPQTEIAALDQSVADVIAKLDGFDPGKLIGDALSASWEQDLLPMVEALDVTPVFDALIEALRGLEAQLDGEMERINTAYTALLSARPAAVSASIGTG